MFGPLNDRMRETLLRQYRLGLVSLRELERWGIDPDEDPDDLSEYDDVAPDADSDPADEADESGIDRQRRASYDAQDDDDDDDSEEPVDTPAIDLPPRARRAGRSSRFGVFQAPEEPGKAPDPGDIEGTRRALSHTWLSAPRMTRTEASLRLAVHLLTTKRVASDVSVALTGAEVTKANRLRFPVAAFLAVFGGTKLDPESFDWRDRYMLTDADRALELHNRPECAQVQALLPGRGRLVVEVSGGPARQTRSPTEHKSIRNAIARALTLENVEPDDILAIAVPRSPRVRRLAVQFRANPRLIRAGLRIILVDRAGMFDGLEDILA